METDTTNRLPEVNEVYLPDSPLIAVLSQIMFGSLLTISKEEEVAKFQESIREKYPILKTEKVRSSTLDVNAGSVISTAEHTVWRFSDSEDIWRVSLSPEFVSIETKKYSTRSEFIKRLTEILLSVETHFKPSLVTRVGVRYIDRLKGSALENISNLVNPFFVGLLNSELGNTLDASVSEALINFSSQKIFSRWGLLPPGTTIDPSLVKPIKEKSWILDIDASVTTSKSWNHTLLVQEIGELSDLVYKFFRWSVTSEFLKHYGGKP
jgi:uncharacterized protein (TIGR04255 family)